jgi:hypothetical protein
MESVLHTYLFDLDALLADSAPPSKPVGKFVLRRNTVALRPSRRFYRTHRRTVEVW